MTTGLPGTEPFGGGLPEESDSNLLVGGFNVSSSGGVYWGNSYFLASRMSFVVTDLFTVVEHGPAGAGVGGHVDKTWGVTGACFF